MADVYHLAGLRVVLYTSDFLCCGNTLHYPSSVTGRRKPGLVVYNV